MKVRRLVPRWVRAGAAGLTSQPRQCCHDPGRKPVCSSGTGSDRWGTTHTKLSTKPVHKELYSNHEKGPWGVFLGVVERGAQQHSAKVPYISEAGRFSVQTESGRFLQTCFLCQTERTTPEHT